MMKMTTVKTTCECFKCGGSGFIEAFSGIANGICFRCNGAGVLSFNEVERIRKAIPEYTRVRCEWILKTTPESFEGFTFNRISDARNFAHSYVMNPDANDFYGSTVIEAWRNQGGEQRFHELQEIRRESLSQYSL
jgi:hypothetical protein